MTTFNERLMIGGALRHVVASLPPEAARALAALVASAGSEQGIRDLLADLRKEGMFNAEGAAGMADGDAIALASFRYHLGRMTAAVHVCVEQLERQWPGLSPSIQSTILSEIKVALDDGAAGMRVDAAAWRGLVERVEAGTNPSASPAMR